MPYMDPMSGIGYIILWNQEISPQFWSIRKWGIRPVQFDGNIATRDFWEDADIADAWSNGTIKLKEQRGSQISRISIRSDDADGICEFV